MSKRVACVVFSVLAITYVIPAFAGDLYDELSDKPPGYVLAALFAKEGFDQTDVEDLDALFAEYNFTEEHVKMAFWLYQLFAQTPVPTHYMEVILFHFDRNRLPPLNDEELAAVEAALREKAAMFFGSVRLIAVMVDGLGMGVCRWASPNAFLVLYAARQALGGGFPGDGATLASRAI